MTAERLQCNQVSSGYTNRSFVGQNTQVVNGQTYTTTLFVKSNTGTPQPFSVMDNRLNPLPGYSHQGIATDQWTRFVVKGVSIITAINTTRIGLIDSDAGTSNDILIWGAQFELDTTETSYDATT